MTEKKFLWKTLSPEEEAGFRAWARESWKPDQPINVYWHPVIRVECYRIIEEEARHLERTFAEMVTPFLAAAATEKDLEDARDILEEGKKTRGEEG